MKNKRRKGGFMTNRMDVNNTLNLVVVGFEAANIINFERDLKTKKFIVDKNFNQSRKGLLPTPPGIPPFQASYQIKNDDFLTIEYNLSDKKLIITQENYRDNNNQDSEIIEILKSVLTLTSSSRITAFGINYSTDIIQDKKLCLFNPLIENKLGNEYWNTNIGFKTELAFKSTDYTAVYTIFKDENLSEEKGSRYYSFNCNFDFILNVDDKSSKIVEIFTENSKYYDIYEQKREKILEL